MKPIKTTSPLRILVTGGAGYIGSHTCVELLQAGHEVIVIDNLCNSKEESLRRVQQITGKPLTFIQCDLLDRDKLQRVFDKHQPSAVIHFAGLKAVGESVEQPLLYYINNISGTATLLRAMQEAQVRNIVFSSSCTVYGTPEKLPIREDFPLEAISPYGQTKLTIEYMLKDLYASDQQWNISILRYFNPVGAHPGGDIGEDPMGIPNNLMPFITQVAVGEREELSVFGDDYDTPDGTCIRDYIHVVDLARGHLKALEKLGEDPGIIIHNLGTGAGYSVLGMIKTFAEATGIDIPYKIVARRPGDISAVFADPLLAEQDLGWKACLDLKQMCKDAHNWQSKNPRGYPSGNKG